MYNKFHHYMYQSYTYIKILLFTNRFQHIFWKKANVLCNEILTNFKFIFLITHIYGQNAHFVNCLYKKLLFHIRNYYLIFFKILYINVCRQYTIIASIYIAEHIFRSKFRKCQNHILRHSESFNFVIQI